jgi:hypothetical protein
VRNPSRPREREREREETVNVDRETKDAMLVFSLSFNSKDAWLIDLDCLPVLFKE